MCVCVYLYIFDSLLVICHFNILLTGAGVMHEAGYVYSIYSTSSATSHLDILHLSISLFGKSSWLMHIDF